MKKGMSFTVVQEHKLKVKFVLLFGFSS